LVKRWLVAVLLDRGIEAFHHSHGGKIIEVAIAFADGDFLLHIGR
jgi:hypothetical protein